MEDSSDLEFVCECVADLQLELELEGAVIFAFCSVSRVLTTQMGTVKRQFTAPATEAIAMLASGPRDLRWEKRNHAVLNREYLKNTEQFVRVRNDKRELTERERASGRERGSAREREKGRKKERE